MQVRTYTLLVTVMTDPASKTCPRIPSPAEMAPSSFERSHAPDGQAAASAPILAAQSGSSLALALAAPGSAGAPARPARTALGYQ